MRANWKFLEDFLNSHKLLLIPFIIFYMKNKNLFFFCCKLLEFIQPQNLWPYIQQNLMQQQNHNNVPFIVNNHHHHHHHHPLHPNSAIVAMNGAPNNNNNSNNNNLNGSHNSGDSVNGLPSSCNNNNNNTSSNNNSPEHHADNRDNKIIAKPLPSRPFIHHGINHPHLHSLLAHCRNPYMTGINPLSYYSLNFCM
jgi:hypothetical protein